MELVFDEKDIDAIMASITKAVDNIDYAPCAEIAATGVRTNFDMGGRYGNQEGGGGQNKWIPRTRQYPWPTLRKTGRLQGSTRYTIEKDGFSLDNDVFYGLFHQKGTRKMVSRPWMVVQDKDLEDITDEMDRQIQEGLE